MKKLILILLIAGVFCASCKEKLPEDIVNQTITLQATEAKTKSTRISIGNTAASIETRYPWKYNTTLSELSVPEKLHYSKKETFQRVDTGENYVILSCNRAKDEIVLSLEGGLEGALKNMELSAKTEITARVDEDMTSHYGFPSVMSSGILLSKHNTNPDVTYRLLILIDGQELYFVLGLFTSPGTIKIEEFEQELHSLRITKT